MDDAPSPCLVEIDPETVEGVFELSDEALAYLASGPCEFAGDVGS